MLGVAEGADAGQFYLDLRYSGLEQLLPVRLCEVQTHLAPQPKLPRHLGTALEDAPALSRRQAVHGRSLARR